jgi:CDP-glucose 4,6-dehydratase
MQLHKKQKFSNSSWNFGPIKDNNKSVIDVINLINNEFNNSVNVIKKNISNRYYESKILMLNSKKSRTILNWEAKYNLKNSIRLISYWYSQFLMKKDILKISQQQIINYFK